MIPISVCIIAKNEEKFIGECLKRLKPYGFELIVVDTGSTDNTKFIASEYTEEIYNFVWCNDFSKARNYAASKASNEWILSVDCDEHLQNIDIDKLLEVVQSNPEGCGTVTILSLSEGDGIQTQITNEVLRFYNKSKFHYESPIHEQLVDENGEPVSFFHVPAVFFHYGYVLEGEAKKAKQERNITLLKKQLKKEPENAYLYFQLGRSYRMLENYREALKYIEIGLTLDFDYHLIYGKMLVVDYAQTLLDLKEYEKALRIEMLESLLGDFADYVFELGQVYYYNQKPVKAIQQFIKLMGMEEGMLQGTTTYWAYFMLARVYHDIDEEEMSEYFLEKYKETVPEEQDVFHKK